MATAEVSGEQPAAAAPPPNGEQRFVLRAIDWPTYRAISDALTGRHFHLAFDGENLELVTVSSTHGHYSRLLGWLVAVLTEELNLPISGCDDMTCDREDVERAVESDECFYLQNEPLVRGKEKIDLNVDPPPDLAIEIDITRSSINRLKIYAALRVPEVWRFNGETLRVYRLGPDGQYALSEQSGHFPFLPLTEMAGFLRRRTEMDDNSLMRAFRTWVREQIAGGWQASP
jgi:Uma2 family endonuclease